MSFRLLSVILAGWIWFVCTVCAAGVVNITVAAHTLDLDSDSIAVYYDSRAPLLLANEATADHGGLRSYGIGSGTSLLERQSRVFGRTKLVEVVYDVGDKDLAISIAQPDSLLRVFELPQLIEVDSARFKRLGDWSALCSWRSLSRNQYVFMFGKGQVVQFLVRSGAKAIEIVEVQSFGLPIEVASCATSQFLSRMFIAAEDKIVYALPLDESTTTPRLSKIGQVEEEVSGLALYVNKRPAHDYLLVSSDDAVAVHDATDFSMKGTLRFNDVDDVEVKGLSIYQRYTHEYLNGFLAYSIESEDINGLGVTSLEHAFPQLNLTTNSDFSPHHRKGCYTNSPICDECSQHGFCDKTYETCACFTGYTGKHCGQFTCEDNCSQHGKCIGPNMCACDDGWGGLHCSFVLVEAAYETTANGGDGDDPAIWIAPNDRSLSRVITTTKSKQGAGLAVFDLQGHLVQTVSTGEPNNVDIIYGFPAGNRSIDLAFAACREDDTLCLFEILPNGTITEIAGGHQPVVDDFTVYGSCTYRSPKSGKQYLFVNEKSSRYLQYELTSTADGTLNVSLVRDFNAGSGGQVEGCVTDEVNGWLILGEEPSALWRYDAEPDSNSTGVEIARVGDGTLYADVEGVTIVYGKSADEGFFIVSCQGVSAYNVYRRSPPHEYMTTFTITASKDNQVDAVTNTDGIAAVGARLNDNFPFGLLVAHDDANELPDGSTSAQASFKLVSLEDVLGPDALGELHLLESVNAEWDPRFVLQSRAVETTG